MPKWWDELKGAIGDVGEDVGEWFQDNVNPTREVVKALARKYALRKGEGPIFNAQWDHFKRGESWGKDHASELDAALAASFAAARTVIAGGTSGRRGHQHVVTRHLDGAKYVVFSDHHIAPGGHRQAFFQTSGNRALYEHVLSAYYGAGYTLVENGDVEELVIVDVTEAQARDRAAREGARLADLRRDLRLRQLDALTRDANLRSDYYRLLADFQAKGRLVRVAGNHDYDLQDDDFLAKIRTVIPGLERPCDYLRLTHRAFQSPVRRTGDAPRAPITRPSYLIAHGHQFDHNCEPTIAANIGETISEALAWAFQGPDRIWRWSDDAAKWPGGTPFRNQLVTDDFDLKIRFDLPQGITRGSDMNIWEALFKHNIAWEYFESATPSAAVFNEVLTGNEFFKYRHMDEVRIVSELGPTLQAEGARLLLGHSHEPRLRALRRNSTTSSTTIDYYLNSAAAGRFENLIWGIEIVDGEATLVSWSCPLGPGRGAPQRRAYTAANGQLSAGAPAALP